MRSPVCALIWQQWRQTRWLIAAGLAAVLTTFLLDFADGQGWIRDGYIFVALTMVVECFVLSAFVFLLLASHSDPNDLRAGLPHRMFVLPVRTRLLVTSQFLYRLAAVGLVFLVAAFQLFWAMKGNKDASNSLIVLLPLLCMTLVAYFQAMLWCLAGAGFMTALVVAVGVLVYLTGGIGLARSLIYATPDLEPRAWFAAGFTGVLPIMYVASVAGAKFARCGGWLRIRAWLSGALRGGAGRQKPFVSPAHAQRWFEWKRRGRILPILACCFFLLLSFGTNLFGHLVWYGLRPLHHSYLLWSQIAGCIALAPALAAFISALLSAGMDYRDRTYGFSSFTMVRPMSARNLGIARLRTGVRSILTTYGLMLIVPILLVLVDPRTAATLMVSPGGALSSAETMRIVGEILMISVALVVLSWALLWFAVPLVGGIFCVISLLACLSVFFREPNWPIEEVMWVFLVPPAVAVSIMAALCVAASIMAALWAAYRRKLISCRGLVLFFVLWFVVALGGAFTPQVLGWQEGFPLRYPALCIALAMIPGASIATVPLKMHWLRTR